MNWAVRGADRLLFEFNFEAWVRLDVVNDLVIASNKIGDRDPTLSRCT